MTCDVCPGYVAGDLNTCHVSWVRDQWPGHVTRGSDTQPSFEQVTRCLDTWHVGWTRGTWVGHGARGLDTWHSSSSELKTSASHSSPYLGIE
ncbi:hypothetical protein FHG87_006457 [Trinorchestia longiramus]|nr:hypothetical protein FHG87_006457 [Trinorchestia longiramus]